MQCFFLKSSTFSLSVTFLDDVERLFNVPVNQKASATLSIIAKSIPVSFVEYFGLKYYDRFQKSRWIHSEKSLYTQLKKSQIDRPSNIHSKALFRYSIFFEVRYYPRDPTSINDEHFRYQIFLQIRKDLASNKLTIKDERIVSVLCALILQSDFGDYDINRFAPHYIRQSISSHLLTPNIEDQIKSEHIKLRGVEPVDAEYRFLEKARWLENYGTIIFPVKDNANKNCYLGLNPQGFALRYNKDNNSKCDIFWPRISAIKRKGRQLVIKERGESTVSHRFETGEKCLCKTLHKLSQEHYAFFKLKKDDKPLVKEPTKRTFGKSSSREFGYSSDTSDNNQYSDDTMSSYPDSINTTQSSKTTKGFKKAAIPIRNCVSDAEESALSKKNRKVIVCKSQTETEDDVTDHRTLHSSQHDHLTTYVSHDRIPADYIYENKLNDPPIITQNRQKRLTKKVPVASGNDRKFYGHRELEPFLSKTVTEPVLEECKYQIPYKSIRTREAGYYVTRSRSGDGLEGKAKIRRKLPQTEILPQSMDPNKHCNYNTPDKKLSGSTSVDSIIALRTKESPSSPSKRLLPNVVTSNSVMYTMPPVPKHRPAPKPQTEVSVQNRPQSLYTDVRFNHVFNQTPPRIPQRNISNPTAINVGQNYEKEDKLRIMSKSYMNNSRKSIPETGI